MLELEKKGTDVSYKYVFDAKYRIETNTDSGFYPDNKPGPKVDDINTMHRYRDSIVYENPQSKFTFEKTMFGAYILFPYDDWKDYSEGEHFINQGSEPVRGHRFYRSIDTVNIGGLPFLPGATELVERLLADLINDSKESAFERATLPRGIEEKLAHVDWEKRDVLIETFRNREQFDICFEKNFYYVPAKPEIENKLPIHYVALYQTKRIFGEENGQIEYYGEAIRVELVKRSSIREVPVRRNNGDELYYRITVREWKKISETNENGLPIKPKESGFVVDFTNMFLMQHSEFVQELRFMNEAEYRFYSELKRSVQAAGVSDKMVDSFVVEDSRFVFSDGEIIAIKDGKVVDKKSIVDFNKRPAQVFRMLQNSIGMGK